MARSGIFNFLCTSLFTILTSTTFAQPANDDCINAIQVVLANSESEAVLVEGDTHGATASTTPTSVCSQNYYTDDVWYKFTTPTDLPVEGIVIKAYYNNLENPTDLASVGMAVYTGCAADELWITCYVNDVPELNTTELPSTCLLEDQEYLIRIWSGGADSTTEGTFRIGVFLNTSLEPYLWWETFGGGLEANGWTTDGSCAIADSNANAGWKYLPDGLIDKGAYIFPGAGISSPTLCDGAVGVDSDYNDNGGIENNFGGGPCPAPGSHTLISPVIYSGNWNVAGLSISWTQAIRQFQSTFFFAFRVRDAASEWSEWNEREINTEYPVNGDFVSNEVKRFQMPGAIGKDSIQLRFIYNDNYYFWAIDDVKIIPQECSNSRISRFYAIPPFTILPGNQVYPFPVSADVFNIGACPITSGQLQCTVVEVNSQDTVYNESISFGTIQPDSTFNHQIFPTLVELPGYSGNYKMTYTLTQDSLDYNPSDNEVSTLFYVGGSTFALEDGFTRSVSVAESLYDTGAPPSYAYGNYFRPAFDIGVQAIEWGVNDPDEMVGQTVQIYLLQWTDDNQNDIAEVEERHFIGFADYTFKGDEGVNVILNTPLENFSNPGEPVIMRGGLGYIAIIEYQALSSSDPQFFMLASEARDYTPQQVAMDSAVAHGLVEMPIYFSVLGWSPDGIITNIDYEVKELDPNDYRIFFGNQIVPVVRIVINEDIPIDGVASLSSDQIIAVFPNPGSDKVQVKLEFTQSYSDVKLRLIDNLGRVVYYKALDQTITEHVETISVNDLPSGNYILQVETIDGQRSVPVIVTK